MCFSSRNSNDGEHIFVCKNIYPKTLSGALRQCAISRAAAPSAWKGQAAGAQKKAPPFGGAGIAQRCLRGFLPSDKFTLTEHKGAAVIVYRQGVALGIAALNDGLGDQGLHAALDEPLDGTCTINTVVGRIDDEVLGGGGDLQLEVLALLHALAQILQLQIHDLAHLVLGQTLVVDDLIQTVQKFGTELALQQLFDEVEKAHPDVFNILLQVLDDGRITDSQGRTVDFKNTVIILTSNLGSDIILNDLEQRRAQGSNELSEDAKHQIDLLLKSKFRPEFLNRLDEIVYYKSLTKDEMRKIVDLQLQDLRNRMEEGKHLKLEVTTAAKDFIIDSAYDSVYGARPIKRFIQSRVETLIAKAIIKGNYAEGDTLTVDYDGSALVLR